MNDPLAQLKPIQLPAEPGWFPPAPGWWLLALAIVLTLLGLWLWLRRRQQRRAPLRQALLELDALQSQQQGQQLLVAVNQLLRRAARQAHGSQAASLGNQAWADFLDQHAPADLQARAEQWQGLAMAAYRPDDIEAGGEYIAISRAWLRSNLAC